MDFGSPRPGSMWLGRLSIRVRVTLAVAVVMAVVLASTGLFLYLRLGAELDATIDQGLRTRVGDVTALVQSRAASWTPSGGSALTERGENLAQVLDPSGAIVDSTPTLRGGSFLTAAELARARRGPVLLDHKVVPGEDDDRARLLAAPVTAAGQGRFVVVVGAALEGRRDALRNLAGLLLVGGPVALVLASIAGYGAAVGALRPVERMRRQAAAIQAVAPPSRLPVPPADDEIGRLGRTLNAMLARLEAAFARERTFVSDASHELRTPLAILKAELELALASGRTRDELEAAVASAAEETDRLVELAEDLLVIARADQGRLPIRISRLEVAGLLEGVVRRFERRAAEAGATLTVRAPVGLHVEADPLRLEQAVGNLVDNALRYGGAAVELSAEVAGGCVRLSVVDDGPGFPVAFVDSAFERFTRADSARGRGGSGLGLAIVDAIARAHGGTASGGRRAAPARGAEVSVTLPAAGAMGGP